MTASPRVALFCETYHEINGVALTARQLVAYAKRHDLPLLAIHGGKNPGVWNEGKVRRIELKRSWERGNRTRPGIRFFLLALSQSNPEGIAIVPAGGHSHSESRRTGAALRVPFAPIRCS